MRRSYPAARSAPMGGGRSCSPALVHGHGPVVAQRRVAATTNEIGAFAPLLDDVDLTGRLVTADSLHTQRSHARYLVEDPKAAYLLMVKGNQAGLVEAINRIPEQAFSPTAPAG